MEVVVGNATHMYARVNHTEIALLCELPATKLFIFRSHRTRKSTGVWKTNGDRCNSPGLRWLFRFFHENRLIEAERDSMAIDLLTRNEMTLKFQAESFSGRGWIGIEFLLEHRTKYIGLKSQDRATYSIFRIDEKMKVAGLLTARLRLILLTSDDIMLSMRRISILFRFECVVK